MTSKELIKKYPELFGKPPFDPKETLIGFGLEVGSGWLPILDNGFKELSELVKSDSDIYGNFKILQVKEKFGTLRVYCNFYTPEIDVIIDEMESSCMTTCELCGSPGGKMRESMWMAIRCNTCFDKYQKEMYD